MRGAFLKCFQTASLNSCLGSARECLEEGEVGEEEEEVKGGEV